jgi:hypothetical protein
MFIVVIDKDAELMRYEECVKEYTELLDDLALIKKGKDLSATEFVNRCDDLISRFNTLQQLGIYEEQARALAINDLSDFKSEIKGLKPEEF